MAMSFEAWPKCTQCGGRHFERRPFASDDIICLECGYLSKAADCEREPVNQPAEDESDEDARGAAPR
jgi:hypothetical protein